MSKKKKILIVLVLVLLVGGYEAKAMLMPPVKVKEKVAGQIYILPTQFLVNLTDGRYGKVNVALVLAPGQNTGATAEAAPTTDGYGTLPEEAVVRAIITNDLTNQSGSTLIGAAGRARVVHMILLDLNAHTDVKVDQVLFTDVAVQ